MTAEEVRDLRRTLGWTQERLARELNVSWATVQRWEQGTKPLPAHQEKLEQLKRRIGE